MLCQQKTFLQECYIFYIVHTLKLGRGIRDQKSRIGIGDDLGMEIPDLGWEIWDRKEMRDLGSWPFIHF